MPFLCELGLHEWKLKYVKQNSCEAQEICTRCKKTRGQVKARHWWKKAYTSPNSCEMQETCDRCGAVRGPISVTHDWEWITLNPCATEEVCKRCRAIGQIKEKEHHWKKVYTKPNSCEMQVTCERCSATKGPLNAVHEWEWLYLKPNSCIRQETCKRCKTIGQTDNTGSKLWGTICGDEVKKERFLVLQQSISDLTQAAKLWYIADEKAIWDSRRHAGASDMVNRRPSKVVREFLPHTNILIYGISFDDKELFFFPDRVSVLRGHNLISPDSVYASSGYDGVTANYSMISFRETEQIPSDSEVIDYTWQYVRVDGGPDRRFSHNPRIPVVRYGQIELSSLTGLVLKFHSSSTACAQKVARSLSDFTRVGTAPSYSTSPRAESQREPARSARVDLEGKSPYEILQVRPDASMDEIAAAHRRLARENHPDKVAGLAQEFRELAERRMKAINAAYEGLKRNIR